MTSRGLHFSFYQATTIHWHITPHKYGTSHTHTYLPCLTFTSHSVTPGNSSRSCQKLGRISLPCCATGSIQWGQLKLVPIQYQLLAEMDGLLCMSYHLPRPLQGLQSHPISTNIFRPRHSGCTGVQRHRR